MPQSASLPPARWYRPPGRQPSQPFKLNRNHPLAKGLLGCWVFNTGVTHQASGLNAQPQNLVTGLLPILTVGNVNASVTSRVVNSGGRAILTDQDDWWSLGNSADLYAPSSTFGLVRRRPTGASLASQNTFGDSNFDVYLPYSDGNVYWDYPDSGSRVNTSGGLTWDTALEVCVLHGGAAGRGIWRNGLPLVKATTPTTTASPSGALWLNKGAVAGGEQQEFNIFCTWGRQLSDQEIIAWSNDPYCFLMPANQLLVGIASSSVNGNATGAAAPTDTTSASTGSATGTASATGAAASTDTTSASTGSAAGAAGATGAAAGTDTTSASTGSATGTASATGAGVTDTATASTGTAAADANAQGAAASTDTTAASTGSGSGSAGATGAGVTDTTAASTGSATGTGAGDATGEAAPTDTVTASTGSAAGGALAAGGTAATVTPGASTGSAAGAATAIGVGVTVHASASTGNASGTGVMSIQLTGAKFLAQATSRRPFEKTSRRSFTAATARGKFICAG